MSKLPDIDEVIEEEGYQMSFDGFMISVMVVMLKNLLHVP